MRPSRWKAGRRAAAFRALALAFSLILGGVNSRAAQDQQHLQLDVIINGASIKMIGSFVLFADRRIGATPNELDELGLRVNQDQRAKSVVLLDEIPTLKYEYQERSQTICIVVSNAYRKGEAFDLSGQAHARRTQAGWGAVLNYDLLASSSILGPLSPYDSSLTLDGRAFSPYGVFGQSAILRGSFGPSSDIVRLDTSFRYSDDVRMVSYVAGDTIGSGLAWSRPIRIGGFQAESNFALRPDLVTMPLPSLTGTAVVPSTVDVYVNNVRTFSQDVATGPFSVNNVPLVSGGGNAQLVIRDSAGHETQSTMPFYASANLLAPGLMSWSVETGLPRLSYGSGSDVYVGSVVGSATLRRGIFDWLTLESHAEAGDGTANGGAGAVIRTGNFGVAGAALSASESEEGAGLQSYLSYETRLFGMNFSASTQRSYGGYSDLASATARLQAVTAASVQESSGFFGYLAAPYLPSLLPLPQQGVANASLYASFDPPRAIDRITVGMPLSFDRNANVSLSYIHLLDTLGTRSDIVSATYTRSMPFGASLFATVFGDVGTSKSVGVFAGLNLPLGKLASASTSVSATRQNSTFTTDAVKSLGTDPGSYGWHIRDAEGAVVDREVSGAYRSNYGTIQVGASDNSSSRSAALELRGSITTMGGGVFLSNWVDDGFAVVDVGAPGVEVLSENRPVGVTNGQGMLLVPTLRAYQANKITVDPTNLPVDAEIDSTHDVVAPADRAGVLVKFKTRSDAASALVTFVSGDGHFIPAGSMGHIENGEDFVVGYDGEAYLRNLGSSNRASIEMKGGSCQAAFPFSPQPGEQVRIASVLCR
jgi:outer membrane usher protein